MTDRKLRIPILLGTVRKGRMSEHVAKFMLEQMQAHPEIETQLFDPREMNLPMDDEGRENLRDMNPDYRDAIVGGDGLVVVTPEYNRGYPGSLKRALDILLPDYIHKVVGFVGVSAGPFGGARVIEALLPVARELGLVSTFTDLNIFKVQDAFNTDGKLLDEAYIKRADKFLAELIWMAKVMRWGRENVPSQYHEA